MEVIELTSYTDEEKLQIAKRYLLPKQMKEHGLNKAAAAHLPDDAHPGRSSPAIPGSPACDMLERQLGKLCRKTRHAAGGSGVEAADCHTGEILEELSGRARVIRPDVA